MHDLKICLAQYLQDWQQEYTGSKLYEELCVSLYDYLRASYDDRDELRQVMEHAKDNFEHYCRWMNSQKAEHIKQVGEAMDWKLNGPSIKKLGWQSIYE